MPTYRTVTRNEARDDVTKWYLPYWLIGEGYGEALLELRKRYNREYEEMLVLQKEAGAARDGETAKFFKGEARDRLKLYRAACLLIPRLLNEYPGDCIERDAWDFPEDLSWPLDMVCGAIEMMERGR